MVNKENIFISSCRFFANIFLTQVTHMDNVRNERCAHTIRVYVLFISDDSKCEYILQRRFALT